MESSSDRIQFSIIQVFLAFSYFHFEICEVFAIGYVITLILKQIPVVRRLVS